MDQTLSVQSDSGRSAECLAQRGATGQQDCGTTGLRRTELRSGEEALVKLYMDLTGETESQGRSVLMFVSQEEEQNGTTGLRDYGTTLRTHADLPGTQGRSGDEQSSVEVGP